MADSTPVEATSDSVTLYRYGRSFRISVLAFGDPNRPVDVVWLHANGLNAATYRHTLAPVGARLRVLAVDQRGHGGTPQDRDVAGRCDAYDLRDDLLALLEIVAPERPVVLAGHSMGGCVSLLAAAEAPERVRGIALFDPVVLSLASFVAAQATQGLIVPESPLAEKARTRRTTYPSRQAVLDSYLGRTIFKTWPDEAVESYVQAGFREVADGVELTCAPEWEASNFTGHGHDIWAAMARVEAPVAIYRAEQGSTCSIARSEDFPRPAGQVEVTTVPGTTHFLPIERPDLVQKALLERAG